mmetsp:Transcript_38043/g.84980  ORF Transcript_38043/g.84980 Transcript_38043/m.84980 type:complete len:201 (+) Transcript_38043:1286-1888(+)
MIFSVRMRAFSSSRSHLAAFWASTSFEKSSKETTPSASLSHPLTNLLSWRVLNRIPMLSSPEPSSAWSIPPFEFTSKLSKSSRLFASASSGVLPSTYLINLAQPSSRTSTSIAFMLSFHRSSLVIFAKCTVFAMSSSGNALFLKSGSSLHLFSIFFTTTTNKMNSARPSVEPPSMSIKRKSASVCSWFRSTPKSESNEYW